jgi:hypothetical protein
MKTWLLVAYCKKPQILIFFYHTKVPNYFPTNRGSPEVRVAGGQGPTAPPTSLVAGVGEEAGSRRRGRSGRPAPGIKRAAGTGRREHRRTSWRQAPTAAAVGGLPGVSAAVGVHAPRAARQPERGWRTMRRPEWEWRAAGTGVGREAGGRLRHGQPATWAARDGGVDGAGGVTAEWSGRPDDFDLYLRRRGRPGGRHRTSSPTEIFFFFIYLLGGGLRRIIV